MTRLITFTLGFASLGGVVPGRYRFIFLACAAIGAIAWAMRCRHRGPLGLLPSIVDEAGERLPARWYCDNCGRSWPANFEHEHAPVQRFKGYDESKAVTAARRAKDLERARRALAIRCSGVDASYLTYQASQTALRAVDAATAQMSARQRIS
jgi:hypothetical protein